MYHPGLGSPGHENAGRSGPPSRAGGVLVVHPKYTGVLAALGLRTPADVLALPGEVVSGHPDRHVVRVQLSATPGGPRVAYLKRQHVVRWRERLRSRLAGFGWASKCGREAATLSRLDAAGLPAPQWLCHGEGADGRSFLLVAELAGAVELRAFLADPRLSSVGRRRCSERLGHAVAELHAAGFANPELTAKHVYIDPTSLAPTVIDWQAAGGDPLGALAALHASLGDELASAADRLRGLWAYRRVLRLGRPGTSQIPFSRWVVAIERAASKLRDRRSIRDQRRAAPAVDQRLVWLAGEAACVVPEVVAAWPTPADGFPFYDPATTPDRRATASITLAEGRTGWLVRGRSFAPLGRLAALVRGKPWRSPEVTLARVLFHLQRYGVPAPRLLGFGQKLTTPRSADGFVLYEPPAGAVAFNTWYRAKPPRSWRRVLEGTGLLLRQIHDAGCRIDRPIADEPFFHVIESDALTPVVFGAVRAVRITRKVSEQDRLRDVHRLFAGPLAALYRRDGLAVLRGYLGGRWTDAISRRWRKVLARGPLSPGPEGRNR